LEVNPLQKFIVSIMGSKPSP